MGATIPIPGGAPADQSGPARRIADLPGWAHRVVAVPDEVQPGAAGRPIRPK